MGTVNLHASLLPDYRGAAPINWVIINREKHSGVTTFLLKHEIDSGNVIFQEKVDIPEDMTAGELHDELMVKGADLLLRTVRAIENGEYPLVDQSNLLQGREAIHAPKIFKEDMRIDWNRPLAVIYKHIRGLSPYPAAWTEIRNCSTGIVIALKIFKTEKIRCSHDRMTGSVETNGHTTFDIYVPEGMVRIVELQLSGKRKMKTEEFLRGFRLEEYRLVL